MKQLFHEGADTELNALLHQTELNAVKELSIAAASVIIQVTHFGPKPLFVLLLGSVVFTPSGF